MKKLLLFFFIIIGLNSGYPQIKFLIGGGLASVQGPPEWTNTFEKLGADFNNELNIGAKVKIGIPIIPFKPVAGITYYFLKGSSSSSQAGDFSKSLNLLSLYAGGEYAFIPGPFSPYANVDIQYNFFMEGKEEFPGGNGSFSGSGNRIGLGLGIGMNFKFLPFMGLDLSVKYNFLNISGKQENEPSYRILNFNLFFSF